MKKTELIAGIIAVLSIILQALLLPGGNVLTVLSLSVLAILYFYCGLLLFNDIRLRAAFKKISYAGISTSRKIGSIGTGFALATIVIGILFKIQYWPGANVMLMDGFAMLVIVCIVAGFKYPKNKSEYYNRIFKRAAIFGGFGLLLMIVPPYSWSQLKYRNHPAYRDALKNSGEDPTNQSLWDKVKEEKEKMDNGSE
jgi:hypothetical protein